jgi:serine/threonine protein kinase
VAFGGSGMLPEVGDVLDGYVIEAVIGRGGMGVVYRARQARPDRPVAMKVISGELAHDPVFRSRFEQEARIAAQIEHPNVVPVYAVSDSADVLYIVMRLIDGEDLARMLAPGSGLDPERAVAIIDQVAQALDAAHARGLVHRDVKPANILVARAGNREHAYLTDFGISRSSQQATGLTATGAFIGTVDYVSPEQIRGESVDARADTYSLGCLLFHALTGSVPYPLDSSFARMYAHGAQEVPSLLERNPSLPPELDQVVRRAMAKQPDERYLSAGDLGRAALAAVSGNGLSRVERSVASGDAGPRGVTPVTPVFDGTEPPAESSGSRGINTAPPTNKTRADDTVLRSSLAAAGGYTTVQRRKPQELSDETVLKAKPHAIPTDVAQGSRPTTTTGAGSTANEAGKFVLGLTAVKSFIVVTRQSTSTHRGTFSDLQSVYRRVLAQNLLFGWWGLPLGPIWTVTALYRNQRAFKQLRAASEPSGSSPNAPAPAPTRPAPSRRKPTRAAIYSISALVGVAAIAAIAVIAVGGSSAPVLRTAAAGPWRIAFRAPWRSVSTTNSITQAFRSPVIFLKSGNESFVAGTVARPAPVPAGLPPQLQATPPSSVSVLKFGPLGKAYGWTSDNRYVIARVIPGLATDYATVCTMSDDPAAITKGVTACTKLAKAATLDQHVQLLSSPGPDPLITRGLKPVLQSVATVRTHLRGLLAKTLKGRAAPARAIQRADTRAASALNAVTVLPRNQAALRLLTRALGTEATAFGALAAASGADNRISYLNARKRVEAASKSVAAASAIFATAGMDLSSLGALVIPALPAPLRAEQTQTYTAPTYVSPASTPVPPTTTRVVTTSIAPTKVTKPATKPKPTKQAVPSPSKTYTTGFS